MKNRNLWIVFALLLAFYLFSQFFSGKDRNRSFDPDILMVDTAAISRIEISSKGDEYQPFTLDRSEDGWKVSNGSINADASASSVNAFLGQLKAIKATRVVAKKKEKWAAFEIGDEVATAHVKVYEGNKKSADFWIGGFRFNQQRQSAVSFVRKTDAEDVYAIDGFVSMSMSQGFSAYRNKQMMQIDPTAITQLTFTQNGESKTLKKNGNAWLSPIGTTLDSSKVAKYFNALANFNAAGFADDFTLAEAGEGPKVSLKIEGHNFPAPVSIDCYQVPGRDPAYVGRSSQRADVWFAGDSLSFYRGLFKDLSELE